MCLHLLFDEALFLFLYARSFFLYRELIVVRKHSSDILKKHRKKRNVAFNPSSIGWQKYY